MKLCIFALEKKCRGGCGYLHPLPAEHEIVVRQFKGKQTSSCCKYFLKGNCKIGQDCKYIHMIGDSAGPRNTQVEAKRPISVEPPPSKVKPIHQLMSRLRGKACSFAKIRTKRSKDKVPMRDVTEAEEKFIRKVEELLIWTDSQLLSLG